MKKAMRETRGLPRLSETRYRMIVESSIEFVYILREEKILYINSKMAELFASRLEDMIGKSIIRIVHPDDAARVRAEIYERLEGVNEEQPIRFRSVEKDGRELVVESICRRVVENGEKVLIGTIRDITAQVMRQSELERENRAMKLLFMVSQLFSGREDNVNNDLKKACELVVESGEAESCSFTLINRSEDTAVIAAAAHKTENRLLAYNPIVTLRLKECPYLLRALESMEPVTMRADEGKNMSAEMYQIMEKGMSFCVILPLVSDNRSIGAMILGYRKRGHAPAQKDFQRFAVITRQIAGAYGKNLLAVRLSESEAQYRELFDYAVDMVFKTDAGGLIEDINAQFTVETGYDPAEWIGKPFKMLLSGMTQPDADRLDESNERFEGAEFTLHTDFGEKYFYISSWPRFDKRDKVVGSWRVARNITDQKKNELELIKTRDKTEEANKAKSMFLANMSHELRTPLTAIIGFGNLISTNKNTSGEIKEQASIVVSQGESLLKLINNTLDLVTAEKHPEVKLNEVSLIDLMKAAVEKEADSAGKKRLTTNISINPLLSEFLVLDEYKVSVVLGQLLDNAVKFTGFGKIKVSAWPEGSMLICMVQDTGIGIGQKHLLEIFENFYQVDGSLTRKYGGAGLGLPLAKSLVSEMGGSIWVKSMPGVGSSFYFSIPLQINPPEIGEEDKDAYHILAADDDKSIRILINDTLTRAGFKAQMVKNGYEALEACRLKKFDVVILNIRMPHMAGDEAVKQIKLIPHYRNVPVIALTAKTMKGDREKYLKTGFDYYIPKPFKPMNLLNRIKSLLPIRKTADKS